MRREQDESLAIKLDCNVIVLECRDCACNMLVASMFECHSCEKVESYYNRNDESMHVVIVGAATK